MNVFNSSFNKIDINRAIQNIPQKSQQNSQHKNPQKNQQNLQHKSPLSDLRITQQIQHSHQQIRPQINGILRQVQGGLPKINKIFTHRTTRTTSYWTQKLVKEHRAQTLFIYTCMIPMTDKIYCNHTSQQ